MTKSDSTWSNELFESPYTVVDLLDDFIALGDPAFMMLLPSDTPEHLRQNLIAAVKAHVLGLKSMDYTLKRYGPWQASNTRTQIEPHTEDMLNKSLEEVNRSIENFARIKGKPGTLGLVSAGGTLFPLQSSFRASSLMTRLGYTFESFVILRLILEQIAWSYEIHDIEDEHAFHKARSTKAVAKLKRFLPHVGRLYGLLSDYAHISPHLTREYIEAFEDDYRVTLSTPKSNFILSFILLGLADIFGTVAEFVYRESISPYRYLAIDEGSYRVRDKRPLTVAVEQYSSLLQNQEA